MGTSSTSFDAQQQHLYNGLALPVDYSIFAQESTRPPAGESVLPCWHWNGLARTDSVLAYGYRATLTLSRDRHEGGQRDGQRRNVMLPLHAMILYVVNDERHWRGNGSFHFQDQSFAECIADES